jgi:hypothetical protein
MKFIQIVACPAVVMSDDSVIGETLYALDDEGTVWEFLRPRWRKLPSHIEARVVSDTDEV